MTAIKAYFTVLVVVVFYQTTTLGNIFTRSASRLTRSASRRNFMKFLPDSVESLDRLIRQGGDAIKVKSYEKLEKMYKDNDDLEALKALAKNAHFLASNTALKKIWGFKRGNTFADKCIAQTGGSPTELYDCYKWKAALLETEIFEGSVVPTTLTLTPLKEVLNLMDTMKAKYDIPDDPYVSYLKGRVICEIKLKTAESIKIAQRAQEIGFGDIIDHKQESIGTCIKNLIDFESKVGNSEPIVESKLLLGKAYLQEQDINEALYWLQKAVDVPVRDSKGKSKNEDARGLLESLQLDYFSRNRIF